MASLSLRFGHSGVSGELSRYTLFVFLFFSFRDITIGNSTSPILGMPTLFFSIFFVFSHSFNIYDSQLALLYTNTVDPDSLHTVPLSTSLTFLYPTKDPPINNAHQHALPPPGINVSENNKSRDPGLSTAKNFYFRPR